MTDRIAFWIRQSYYQFIIGFHNLILRLRKRARFNRWVSQSRPAENYLGFNAKQPRRIFLDTFRKSSPVHPCNRLPDFRMIPLKYLWKSNGLKFALLRCAHIVYKAGRKGFLSNVSMQTLHHRNE